MTVSISPLRVKRRRSSSNGQKKIADAIAWNLYVGRDNAITYFEQMKDRELTWLSKVFDDAKEDCKGDDLAKGPT